MPETTVNRVLAFDFGLRRVGVALGIPITETARPLETIVRKGQRNDYWPRVEALLQEWKPEMVLLGWPEHHDDANAELQRAITKFSNQLHTRAGVKVTFVNESYSSIEASDRLRRQRQQGRRQRVQKTELDQLAAAIIVERWFAMPHSEY